jgi:hypothetical protein
MKYLKIANKGEVLVEALTLVGASTKRGNDNLIGMFGSGNKYALAYLLRNGIEPIIYSGNNRINIGVRDIDMRGETFGIITINGRDTSITTGMGHHWELWMAIREIYANAIDEGFLFMDLVDIIEPNENETHFYIPVNDHISDFIFNIDDYFSKGKKVLFEGENGKILKKHSSKARIYRRGILVWESHHSSCFDYDLYNVPINEDRRVNYEWYIWEEMYKLLASCNNEGIIRQVLFNQNNNIEGMPSSVSTINLDYLNDAWDNVLDEKYICPIDMSGYVKDEDRGKTVFLCSKLYNAIHGVVKKCKQPASMMRTSDGMFYEEISEKEKDELIIRLSPVLDFFMDAKIKITHNIVFVRFLDANTFGLASDGKIFLSRNIFEQGNHFIANVIIEEMIHLNSGAKDETRAFQREAINMFLSYIKMINNLKL